MPTNIIDIADLETLKHLKSELEEGNISSIEDLNKFKNEYEEDFIYDKYTCNINFGYNRNLNNFKDDIQNMKPCSEAQNYPKIKEARGPWKNIYEIVFGSGENKTVIAKIAKDEKVKQIIKEAA